LVEHPAGNRLGHHTGRSPRPLLPLLVVVLFADCGSLASAADRIIFRDLKIESSRTVESFDVDGVGLDDGTVVGWDRIKQATVASGQAEFDQLLAELGLPLLRVQQRMKSEDYRGVSEPAEALLPKYLGRDSETAFVVTLAATWGRIASGRQEEALVPYLYCLDWIKRRKGKGIPWPGKRRLDVDLNTGICQEIPPLWTDSDRAAKVLPDVGKAIGAMARPWLPGVRIYYAALANAANEDERVTLALRELPSDEYWTLYRTIALSTASEKPASEKPASEKLRSEKLRSEKDKAILREGSLTGDPLQRALSLYWLGRQGLAEDAGAMHDAGLVDLIRVAAIFGDDYSGVAAQALYLVMEDLQKAGDAVGAVAVRREILERYGTSAAADRLRQ
jgi:hypothetical protein